MATMVTAALHRIQRRTRRRMATGDDGGNFSESDSGSREEVEMYEGTPEETDKGDVNNTGGLQLYKLTDADKTRFRNMVSRHT